MHECGWHLCKVKPCLSTQSSPTARVCHFFQGPSADIQSITPELNKNPCKMSMLKSVPVKPGQVARAPRRPSCTLNARCSTSWRWWPRWHGELCPPLKLTSLHRRLYRPWSQVEHTILKYARLPEVNHYLNINASEYQDFRQEGPAKFCGWGSTILVKL